MSGLFIDGKLIHYEAFGRGDPIVFLHGWMGSWRYWFSVMEDLALERRSYGLDLWGFGDSDKSNERYDVGTYVDMLIAFMDELGIWRAPVVGHTLGAAIAVELAASHPDRVSKVMAVSLPLTADAINRRLLSAGPNDLLARLFWRRQRPYPEVEMSVQRTAKNAIALTIQSVARLDLSATFEKLEVPLLSVYGEKDSIVDARQADELGNNHSAARAIVLPDAFHFPMLDQEGAFARLLRDFMDIERADELWDLAIKQEWRRRTR
jgi:pimeloyl-ACP methyl ester carboxylesterase